MRRALALGLIACLNAPSAEAAIAALNSNLAIATYNSSGATVATTLTTGATTVDAPVGTLIVIVVGNRSTTNAITSCTDSAGNAYSASAATTVSSGLVEVRSFYSLTTIDLPIGATFSCTVGSGNIQKSVVVGAFSGLASSGVFDATVTNIGTVSPVTFTTGTLNFASGGTQALVIAADAASATTSYTESASFTSMATLSNSFFTHLGFQIVNATTGISYSAAFTASATWAAQGPDFKGSGGGAACVPTLALLGVSAC
ncbi:MAG: hypothetical protein JWP75_417 [Frondihabitans sp.]|nr:hypothetical protein [Frondihabitans sp.]